VLAVKWREQHAWLDWLWKVALVGAVVTTTAQSGSRVQPLGGRWSAWLVAEAAPADVRDLYRLPTADGTAHLHPSDVAQAETAVPCCGSGGSQQQATSARGVATASNDMIRGIGGFVRSYWPGVLGALWLLIAVVGVLRFARRQRTLYRVLADRRAVLDVRLTHALAELTAAGGMRRALRLTVTSRCPVPVALRGGEIVVPERFLTELDAEQQRAALAHEVAHQLRRDPTWLLLVHMLEAVFFFQPLQRRARSALRAEAEVLCDDWAVRQTVSIGVARCLATVAAWVTPAPEWQLTAASGMACTDSALVQRVDRVLRGERVRPKRRTVAFATLLLLPLLLLVAPVVSSADIPVSGTLLTRLRATTPERTVKDVARNALAPAVQRALTVAQERVIRAPRPADPLEARWSWALEEAARRRLRGFYVVYSFYRPVPANQQFISDSHGVNITGELFRMTPLATVLDGASPIGGRGTIGAVFHFAGADDGRIDRVGHRSMTVGYDFGGEPVFWLGYADEAESLARLERLFERMPADELRGEVVEAYGIHPTTDRVLPFLSRVLQAGTSEHIRAEAAESLEYHADPRVVPLLARAARTDPAPTVRVEAAEALGGVDVPAAVSALLDLALRSEDAHVRTEAAEALGDQSPDRALRALGQLIEESTDPQVRVEGVEALGTLGTRAAQDALVRIVWEHRSRDVQREAVEALGDHPDPRVLEQLEKILVEHRDEQVAAEALDVLGEVDDPRIADRIAQAARTSPSAHVRREALEWLGAAQKGRDDRAAEQLAAVLERVIFEDKDRSVQLEALDVAAESLPRALARRLLRQVVDRHPAAPIREEARELLEDIG
jgi:HEAT repeat protein/beta-lactamase regulating signal transducer with metallopeptidase domain